MNYETLIKKISYFNDELEKRQKELHEIERVINYTKGLIAGLEFVRCNKDN